MNSRAELELVWQIGASLAWRRYEARSREFIRLVGDLRKGRYQPPDCSETLRAARQRESLALEEYMRILRIYTDLVAHGTLPEESWSVTMDRRPGPNG